MSNFNIKEMVNEEVVELDYLATDRDSAIREAGNILVNNGCVSESYVDAMVESCNKFGPYIVILPGLAIPHANSDKGVNRVGISILRLKEPIVFGNKENDPVKIVIAVATPDSKSHLELLSNLSKILFDPKKLASMVDCNKKELIELFAR